MQLISSQCLSATFIHALKSAMSLQTEANRFQYCYALLANNMSDYVDIMNSKVHCTATCSHQMDLFPKIDMTHRKVLHL